MRRQLGEPGRGALLRVPVGRAGRLNVTRLQARAYLPKTLTFQQMIYIFKLKKLGET
jgi:hypothetical protein